jgi:predicted Fe-Mo cluster-binding NifX family protein
MKVVVAVQEPHLRGAVAPKFEGAPYYVAVDTQAARTRLFLHPAQFQVAFTPAGLVRRLREFSPEAGLAGSVSAEAQQAAAVLQIELLVAHGRAADAVDQCAGTTLPGGRA